MQGDTSLSYARLNQARSPPSPESVAAYVFPLAGGSEQTKMSCIGSVSPASRRETILSSFGTLPPYHSNRPQGPLCKPLRQCGLGQIRSSPASRRQSANVPCCTALCGPSRRRSCGPQSLLRSYVVHPSWMRCFWLVAPLSSLEKTALPITGICQKFQEISVS